MKIKKKIHFSKSNLLERGWTDGLINKFYPTPDATEQNPMFKRAAPMKLYLIKNIKRIEKTKKFILAQQKIQSKINGAAKAILTKIDKINQFVDKIKVELKDISLENAVENAILQFNRFHLTKCDGCFADKNSDKDFLDRITVNYLRHCASNYEEELDNIFGKVGVTVAYIKLKNKILVAIKEKYPILSSECDKQMLI